MRRHAMVQAGLIVLAAFAVPLGCGSGTGDPPASIAVSPDEAARLLVDRNWMDRWPAEENERLHVYRFTPAMGGGVYQQRTVFAGHFELFNYAVDGEHLTITWPMTKTEDRMVFRITRVPGPEPFDLRLELSSVSRGPRTLYGRSREGGGAASLLQPFAAP